MRRSSITDFQTETESIDIQDFNDKGSLSNQDRKCSKTLNPCLNSSEISKKKPSLKLLDDNQETFDVQTLVEESMASTKGPFYTQKQKVVVRFTDEEKDMQNHVRKSIEDITERLDPIEDIVTSQD